MHRKYRCMRCGFEWQGRRVLTDDDGRHRWYNDPPLHGGMTECVKCFNIYVEWVNAREILKALGEYWRE